MIYKFLDKSSNKVIESDERWASVYRSRTDLTEILATDETVTPEPSEVETQPTPKKKR